MAIMETLLLLRSRFGVVLWVKLTSLPFGDMKQNPNKQPLKPQSDTDMNIILSAKCLLP